MKKDDKKSSFPSILDILLPIFVLVSFLSGFFHTITAMTQDLGRHFLLGKIILETKNVPLTNLFSYTFPNFPFINLHWLSEVIFYFIYQTTGFHGLLIVSTAVVGMAYGLVFFVARKKQVSIIALSLLSFLSLGILFERTDIRPEIFSFLFLSLFVVILYKFREKFTWLILLLIPLELLWVNLHIYFVIGIGVLGLFCIDEIIRTRGKVMNRKSGILFFITFLCMAATLVNPSGLAGAIYPLRVFENYGYAIEENQSIFLLESLGFQKASILYFKITVLLLFLSLAINFKRTKPIDWLLSLAFTIIGTSAVRNLPLFVFATFIPFALSFSVLLKKAAVLIPPLPHRELIFHKYIAGIILIILLCWQAISIGQSRTFGFGVEPGAKAGVDFMEKNNLKGPIFNNFDIGSYLDYRLYPKERVFIDGRPGEYPVSFFKDTYIPMQENPEKFASVDKKYNFSTIFFSHTDQTPWAQSFMGTILQNPTFVPVYLDPNVLILVKNIPENNLIIEKFELSRTDTPMDYTRTPTKQDLQQAANFYSIVNQQANLIKTLTTLYEKDPQNCQHLEYLLQALLQAQSPLTTIYQAKFMTTCQ